MKKRTLKKIAVLTLAMFLLSFSSAFAAESPLTMVGEALAGFAEEVSARVEHSPFAGFGVIGEALQNGETALSLDLTYDDQSQFLGEVTLKTNSTTNVSQVGVVLTDGIESVEADVVVTADSIAVAVPMLGDGYYGVTYSTLRDDLTALLGDELPIWLVQLLDSLDTALNPVVALPAEQIEAIEASVAVYSNVLIDFVKNLDTKVRTNPGTVYHGVKTATVIDIIITEEDILDLMFDVVEVMREDEVFAPIILSSLATTLLGTAGYETIDVAVYQEILAQQAESGDLDQDTADLLIALYAGDIMTAEQNERFAELSASGELFGIMDNLLAAAEAAEVVPEPVDAYLNMLDMFEAALNEVEIGDLEVVISFALDGNRRLQFVTFANGSDASAGLTLDTGTGVEGDWTLTMGDIAGTGNYFDNYIITWSHSDDDGIYLHSFTMANKYGYPRSYSYDSGNLSLAWSHQDGDFKLSLEDEWESYSIGGVFKYDDEGFTFKLDGITNEYSEEVVNIAVTATVGAQDIVVPEFAGIAEWYPIAEELLAQLPTGLFGTTRVETVPSSCEGDMPYSDEAIPGTATVIIDGTPVVFNTYEYYGETLFKIRDVAYALNGSARPFNVEWNADLKMMVFTPGDAYIPVGGEMTAGDGTAKMPKSVYGTALLSAITAGAQNGRSANVYTHKIDGHNYCELFELPYLIGLDIVWNAELECYTIDTSSYIYSR